MMESSIISYFMSVIVENTTRAGFVYVKLLSMIFAHFLDSGVFGISDFDPSTAQIL